MPTTVSRIFAEFEIQIIDKIRWGKPFNDRNQGIYIVSSSTDPDKHLGISNNIIFDNDQINLWINKLPNFLIDNIPVNPGLLKNRMTSFWLADESILYIGKAPKRKKGTGISKRVCEYYSTEIGDGGPHSGGQWIKVLKNINDLYVYYGYCDKPALTERKMLEYFMRNVSETSLSKIFDKNFPLPFANIRCGVDKKHGLKNQRK